MRNKFVDNLMLVPETSIVCDSFYLGPGNGCHREIRCDAVEYKRELSCDVALHSQIREAHEEIQEVAFRMFRSGTYKLQPPERHDLAISVIARDDDGVIDLMYDADQFRRDVACRELTFRGVMDNAVYRIGEHGSAVAQDQAIQLMKAQAKPTGKRQA